MQGLDPSLKTKSVYLNTAEIAAYLGLGIGKVKALCRTRPNDFPVAKIGNRYQARADLLEAWAVRFFAGEFDL